MRMALGKLTAPHVLALPASRDHTLTFHSMRPLFEPPSPRLRPPRSPGQRLAQAVLERRAGPPPEFFVGAGGIQA